MIRAVYTRTLKPGVDDDAFVEAWLPPGLSRADYPGVVTVSRNVADDRQVVAVFELDLTLDEFGAELPRLVHPDSERRLAAIVDSTQLAAVFVETVRFGASSGDAG